MGETECLECWFLDVGQGTSSVIYLGNEEAIVIDCGPGNSKQTISFLKRYVSKIKALVFSHNDSDHISGAAGVFADFADNIGKIYFLADGKHEKILGLLKTYDPEKKIPTLRAETADDGRGIIFNENDVELEVIYPGLISNLEAETSSNRANQTSAILKLTYGNSRVVFSGDATIGAWKHLSTAYLKEKPFNCDIMTIPHHGGKITSGAGELKAQKELYSKIIKPKYGIVSVGTFNQYHHPCSETISVLVESGIEVLCTQMTLQCCDNLEEIRNTSRIITQPSLSTRREQTTGSGKSKNVACLGTITAQVTPIGVKIDQLNTHHRNKELFSKAPSFKPLCTKRKS